MRDRQSRSMIRRPFGDRLQDEIARWFDWDLPLGRPWEHRDRFQPRVDIYEEGGNLVIKAELPGVKRVDVEITLDDDDLVIRGERQQQQEVKEDAYYRMERSYGTFYRRLPLPPGVQTDDIRATFQDGILEVRMPKPADVEKTRGKKIQIV